MLTAAGLDSGSAKRRQVSTRIETWGLREPFRFNGQTWTDFRVLVCQIEQQGRVGIGEAFGVYYLGDTPESMQAQVHACVKALQGGARREDLFKLMPPGGARNAVDCALWDLEAKLSGVSAWERAEVARAGALSVFNIGLQDTPEEMAARAASRPQFPLLKIKVAADHPVERVAAVRAARPDARMFVDANQAWTLGLLKSVAPELARLGVEMIEQPLPRGADAQLDGYNCPLPLCADESCLGAEELHQVSPWYQRVAIKLDKAGGLTAALTCARQARELGLEVVGGSMMGTTLGMLPVHVLAQGALFSDLESPLHAICDRMPAMRYEEGLALPPGAGGWGLPT